jgi:LCP family protein required for cell wall assembly
VSFFDHSADGDRRDDRAPFELAPLEPYAREEMTVPIPAVRGGQFAPEHEQLLDRLRERGSRREDRPRRRTRRPRSVVRRAVLTAGTFTALLALVVAGLAGYTYRKYNNQITRVAVLQPNDTSIREASRQQHAENFLVIGSDSRAGLGSAYGNVAGARSDTTILIHLSPDRTKAAVISIPRDSWVAIPACKQANGHVDPAHSDMFNSAFSIGGPACTIKTVQKLTGIAVTHFLEVDFAGFKKMVDALGKVVICSPEAVNDPGSKLTLHKGNNKLGGAQALAYVRARETLGDGSDLGRIKRQQMFLGAVLRQAMHGSLLRNPIALTSFLDAATKAITVDKGTTFSDLRTLATSMQGLDPKHVTFYTAPIANADYTPPGTNETGRVLLDRAKGRLLYDSVINDKQPVTVTTVNGHSTVTGGGTTTVTAPKADLTAGQATCSL